MCEEKKEIMDRARPLVRVMLSPVQVMLRPRREKARGQERKRARDSVQLVFVPKEGLCVSQSDSSELTLRI